MGGGWMKAACREVWPTNSISSERYLRLRLLGSCNRIENSDGLIEEANGPVSLRLFIEDFWGPEATSTISTSESESM
jgi:hypothetical protein